MASTDALWNEVARIANIEFFDNEQPLTGELLLQLIIAISEMLTEDATSA